MIATDNSPVLDDIRNVRSGTCNRRILSLRLCSVLCGTAWPA